MHRFNELAQEFGKRFMAALPFPESPTTLYEPCRYFLQPAGKRIRPVLCLMGNELFGDITDDAWHAAMGLELFHNFTLIHDDIMDRAPLRRGLATVHTKYDLSTGVLSGDVMSIYAYQQMAMVRTALPEVLSVFNSMAIQVCEGQQWDMDFEQRDDVSLEAYLNMIELKTSVLLAASVKIGALLGGATVGNADKLYEFGRNLGIAFQLQDDYLDAFGAVEQTGKQQGGDIRDNKKTFLLLTAQQRASSTQRQQIDRLMETNSADKVPEMLRMFRELNVDVSCREMVQHYSEMAFLALEDAAVTAVRKEPLHELATYLLQREK